jgi:hypothetical protein
LTSCGEPPPVNGSAIAWQRTSGRVVEGIVTDVQGARLPGAMVQLYGTGFGAPTDKDGRFRIAGVPAREYQVLVRALGFMRVERAITLGSGEGATVLAVLERAPSGIIYDCFFAGIGRSSRSGRRQ